MALSPYKTYYKSYNQYSAAIYFTYRSHRYMKRRILAVDPCAFRRGRDFALRPRSGQALRASTPARRPSCQVQEFEGSCAILKKHRQNLLEGAGMAELADAADSKSAEVHPSWGFDPPSRHHPSS